MSQIPFVELLGDELARAAQRQAASGHGRARRKHRAAIFAAVGVLVVSGTALATGLFSEEVERQAAGGIVCAHGADPRGADISVVAPAGIEDPVDVCRRVLTAEGEDPGPLVACGRRGHVTVIQGRGAAACVAAESAPLDPRYARSRARTARLERDIMAIEDSADCMSPTELARRVQVLLERSGWAGWTAAVRPDLGSGPCGSVSSFVGDGRRDASGAIDAERDQVIVTPGASRRLTSLLHSSDHSLLPGLFADSGARCHTIKSLSAHARRAFAAEHVSVSIHRTSLQPGVELDDADGRATRYRAGCAVIAGAAPGTAPETVVIDILSK